MIAIPATHYLEYIPALGTYRSKIAFDRIGSFIGIVAMEGHAFYYDLTSDRIGIAESMNCQSKSSLTSFGDDDMFALPSIESGAIAPWGYNPKDNPKGYDSSYGYDSIHEQHGANCTSATCISFVTVGYAIVTLALAVAFKKYRPRDQSKKFEESEGDTDTAFGRESVTLNPDFQQHILQESVEGLT